MLGVYAEEFKSVLHNPRRFLTSTLNLACVVFSALMLWKGLMLYTGSESPIVVVLSGSMEPGFHRGDILFLTLKEQDPFEPGDVSVFSIEGRDIPIVHRIVNVHEEESGRVRILTKGDNNMVDDRGLYNYGQLFIERKNIMGRAQGFLPYAGMVTIWLNDYPWLNNEPSQGVSVEGAEEPVRLSALTVAACGSTAGATAKFVVAPLERVKILYQTNPAMRFSWGSAYRTMQGIVSTHGMRGLWKGYLMVLTRIVPYSATNYTVFDRVNTYLQNSALRQHCPAELIRFLSGNCAGASAVVATYPLDMLRSRLASDTRGEFSSYKDAVRKIYASRGIRGIYGGMYPTLCGIIPYAGTSFMCFETLKAKRREMSGKWTAFDRLICGGFSGLVAQSATYPFDIIRRRQQVHGGRAFPGKGVIRSLVDVARTEGVRKGLYKGLSVNWVKGPIAVAAGVPGVKKMNAADLLRGIKAAKKTDDDDDDSWGLSEADSEQAECVTDKGRLRKSSAKRSTVAFSELDPLLHVDRDMVRDTLRPVYSGPVTPAKRASTKKASIRSSGGWMESSSDDDEGGSGFRLGSRRESSASSATDGSWNWDGSVKSKSAISDWTDSWKSEKSRNQASGRRQTSPPGESWAGYSSQKKHSGRGWGAAAVEKSTTESTVSRRDFSSWGGSWETFASGKGGGGSGDKGSRESSGGGRKSRLSESWHFADSGSTPSFGGDQDDDDVASWASSTSSEAIIVKTSVKRHARVEPRGGRDERTSGKVMRRGRSPGRVLETQVLRGARVNSPARKSVGVGSDEGLQPVRAMGPRKPRAPKSAEMNRQDTYKPTRGFGRPPSVQCRGGARTTPSSAPQKWDLLSAGWSTQGEVKGACHHDCDWMNSEHHHWPHSGGEVRTEPERIDPRDVSEQQQWQKRKDLGGEPSREEGAQRERFVPRPIIALVTVDPTDGALTTLGRVDWRANEDIEGLRQRAVCDLAHCDFTRGRSAEVDCERATRLDDSLEREQQAKEQQPRCEEDSGESSQVGVVEQRLDGDRRVSDRGGHSRKSLLDVAQMEGRDEGRRKSKRGNLQEAFVMDDAFVALEEHYQEVERFERRHIPVEEYVPEPAAQPGAEYRPSVRPSTEAVVETLEPAMVGRPVYARRPTRRKWSLLSMGESTQGFVKHHVHKDAGKKDENARARSLSQKARARSPSQGGPRPCVGPQEKRWVDGPMAGPRPLTPQLQGRAFAVLPAEEMNGGVQQRPHLEEVTLDAYHQPKESSSPPTVFHYHHKEESEVTEAAAHPTKAVLQSAYGAAAVRSALNRLFASKHRDPVSHPPQEAAREISGVQQAGPYALPDPEEVNFRRVDGMQAVDPEELPRTGMVAEELHKVSDHTRDGQGVRSYSFDEEVLVELEFNK
ncbi:hypothetical protein FOL46_008997 [Perkinsus olseni]|uniref:signal peptidase I n=1 Tax=Perkinsus olseni TaxID=32597 RepID=A0A7J6L3P9_PEROL|nr:hypothetical protein FOL46_008997 [Perkinsus olseni]